MNFHVKRSERRIDPKHPESHPDFKKALHAGQKLAAQKKFESEGEKRDYERQIRSNPNNVYGLPAFYPPEQIRMFIQDQSNDDPERIHKMTRERIRQMQLHPVQVLCKTCNEVTPHVLGPTDSYCQKCGEKKQMHGGWL